MTPNKHTTSTITSSSQTRPYFEHIENGRQMRLELQKQTRLIVFAKHMCIITDMMSYITDLILRLYATRMLQTTPKHTYTTSHSHVSCRCANEHQCKQTYQSNQIKPISLTLHCNGKRHHQTARTNWHDSHGEQRRFQIPIDAVLHVAHKQFLFAYQLNQQSHFEHKLTQTSYNAVMRG
jgi:hypothetical protein